jgi:oligopeptide transport system substrate-binding protein
VLADTLNLAHTPQTIYAYPTAFGPIDPIAMVDCFEGLLAADAKGEAIPGQAASWTISPDGLTYTFALREGLGWSNGDPVVSEDFVAAFRWLFDPANAFEFAYLQFPIRNASAIASGALGMDQLGVRALDPRTVEITLERPAPHFLQLLTHSTAYPLPSALLASKGRVGLAPADLVCNGPYVITARDGELTRAEKSKRYYDRSQVEIDAINYYAVDDVPAALERFKAGEIDMFYDLPVSANAWIDANAAGASHVAPFLGLSYLTVNFDRPPFDNVAVRRALSMAIDRSQLDPQGVHSPHAEAHGLVPDGTANSAPGGSYRPEWADWPYERRLAEARAALEGLGYTRDNPLAIEIHYANNADDTHQQVVRAISRMWGEIGVEATLYDAAPQSYLSELHAGDFDVARLTWFLDVSDPANILELMGSASEFNMGHYLGEGVDDLLARANDERDLKQRAALLADIERRLADDVAIIPLHWAVVRNLIAGGLTGIEDNAKNIHPSRWVQKASR